MHLSQITTALKQATRRIRPPDLAKLGGMENSRGRAHMSRSYSNLVNVETSSQERRSWFDKAGNHQVYLATPKIARNLGLA